MHTHACMYACLACSFARWLARSLVLRSVGRAGLDGETRMAELSWLVTDELIRANSSLSVFLTNFIDKNLSRFRWELGARTFLERRFNLPPAVREGFNVTLFYDDPDFAFTSTLMMGIENELCLFYALLYACTDLLFENTLVSCLVTFLADKLVSFARGHWGKANISRKTLIDPRFLI